MEGTGAGFPPARALWGAGLLTLGCLDFLPQCGLCAPSAPVSELVKWRTLRRGSVRAAAGPEAAGN